MAKMLQTTQAGQTRILIRFGRDHDRQNPWRGSERHTGRWTDCDINARGL